MSTSSALSSHLNSHSHHLITTTNALSTSLQLNLTSSTTSSASSSPSLTSLLHQKLTTNNNKSIGAPSMRLDVAPSTNQMRNQSYYHQSSDKNRGQINNHQHQNIQNNNEKKVILNDIAAGLANAVALAVSDAVSSVQQQINHSQERGIAQNNPSPSNTSSQQSPRELPQNPPPPPPSPPQQPAHQQQFSQLRQQLESKNPPQPLQNQTILRKRLSNLNIEAAVTHAVNNYLNTTIKNNQKFSTTRQQLNQDENVILVDDFGKRTINSI